jgi:hypothetical protein
MPLSNNNSGIYLRYKSEQEVDLESRWLQIDESKLILKNSPKFEELKPHIANYVENFNKRNEKRNPDGDLYIKDNKNTLTVDNFIDEFQCNFFYHDYCGLSKALNNLQEKKSSDLLEVFIGFIFDVANVVYFPKFYQEISLDQKANLRGYYYTSGFSFNVSFFAPLRRSVLYKN